MKDPEVLKAEIELERQRRELEVYRAAVNTAVGGGNAGGDGGVLPTEDARDVYREGIESKPLPPDAGRYDGYQLDRELGLS